MFREVRWIMMNEQPPLVSVCIATYNHSAYIKQCIEGVLMQKTGFEFEIFIGDDGSTDGTAEIVLDYASSHPEIITAFTSETNQGAQFNNRRNYSACQGKFVAWCEGDDFWIDPFKLQKQVDAARQHNAVFVGHNTAIFHYKGGRIVDSGLFNRTLKESGVLDVEEIILEPNQFNTSSFFAIRDIVNNKPDWANEAPAGDYALIMRAAGLGKVYYINEVMSVYRRSVPGSWTDQYDRSLSGRDAWRENFLTQSIKFWAGFDKYTDYRYTNTIQLRISALVEDYLETFGNLDFLKGEVFQGYPYLADQDFVKNPQRYIKAEITKRKLWQRYKSLGLLKFIVYLTGRGMELAGLKIKGWTSSY